MIKIKGNILAVKQGFICYQVGCKGTMVSCLARGLSDVWPNVHRDYVMAYRRGDIKLGEVVFTTVHVNKLYIATMCAQGEKNKIDGRSLDYPAMGNCLRKIKNWFELIGMSKLPIYLAHGTGCGKAGGDWGTVKSIIKRETPSAVIIKL